LTVFSRREKVLLALAAAAVAAVVLVVQLTGTAAGTAQGDREREVRQWKALQQRVSDAQAHLRQITVPEAEAPARLLRAAQASGSATGVRISSARPRRPTTTRSGCVEQALELEVTGRFPDIARFVFDLEAKNVNLRIARIAITSSGGGSDQVSCAITVAGYSPGAITKWKREQTASRGRVPPR